MCTVRAKTSPAKKRERFLTVDEIRWLWTALDSQPRIWADAYRLEATFSGAPGIESLFEGTYFSTEADLGFIVEIGHAPDGFVMPPSDSVYPPSGK